MAEKKKLSCPNCGPGTKCHPGKNAGEVVCEQCGGTFTFTDGEAKVTDLGRIDRVEQSLEELREEQRQITAELARRERQAPTEDPDRAMPDRDPEEIVVEVDDDDEDL